MKQLTGLALFFTGFICFNSHAQFDNYKLDQYVNPDYKRQSLDFEFNTVGNFSSEKNEVTDYDTDKYKSSLWSGDLSLMYKKDQNSLSKQSERLLNLSFNGNLSTQKNNDSLLTKDNRLDVLIGYADNSRYYFTNKKFIEFSPAVSGRIRSGKNKTLESKTYDSKSYGMTTSFRLGYGKGRIEHVEDARLAVYLLEDLQSKGVSVKNITPEMIDQLAQCMTAVKYKRHFDSRLQLIDEIATVDSFLLANDIVEKQHSSRYFTTLYDNWQYAGLITRLSGSRFSVGLTPDFYWQKWEDEGSNAYHSFLKGGAYVNYTYEKPVNLYWQHSAFVEAEEAVGRNRGMDENYWSTSLRGSLALGYYPNSRTYMTLTLKENFEFVNDVGADRIYSATNLGFDMYYYLSPQLRLSANAGVNYYYSKYSSDDTDFKTTTNSPKFNFGATLTYSIF